MLKIMKQVFLFLVATGHYWYTHTSHVCLAAVAHFTPDNQEKSDSKDLLALKCCAHVLGRPVPALSRQTDSSTADVHVLYPCAFLFWGRHSLMCCIILQSAPSALPFARNSLLIARAGAHSVYDWRLSGTAFNKVTNIMKQSSVNTVFATVTIAAELW